ncbi:MAG TPA: hypothetical protein VNA12_00715 [Mycobacteriales bacterium]|nr:hypothetical protein [Mycobacteriales bacterium]
MPGERRVDLLLAGGDSGTPATPLGRFGSAIAAAVAVQLLLGAAVVEDRHDRGDDRPTAAASPSPRPSPRQRVGGEEAAARRRAALRTARFAADFECADATGFTYDIVEETVDIVETVIEAGNLTVPDGSRLRMKVTLLPGATSYRVITASPDCRG